MTYQDLIPIFGDLLSRCLDPKNIPWTPSQEVFGCLGYIPEQKNGLFQTASLRHIIFFSLLYGLTYLGGTKIQRIPEWNAEVDLFDSPFEGNFSDLQALRMAILGTWSLGFSFFRRIYFFVATKGSTACSLVNREIMFLLGEAGECVFSIFCWFLDRGRGRLSAKRKDKNWKLWKLLEGQMPIHL